MASLIDSRFKCGDRLWYVNGSAISCGTIQKVIYNYSYKQVYYKLQADESETIQGEVSEKYVFATEIEAKEYAESRQMIKIERESELIEHINTYIKLGALVKKPMVVQLFEGYGRYELQEYLKNNFKYSLLNVDGHPFKRGHEHFINENGVTERIADHPELTLNFFAPSYYNPETPPVVMTSNYMEDYEYAFECVENLKVPFIIVVPPKQTWVCEDGPAFISECEAIIYSRTLDSWLTDLNAEDTNVTQKRLLESISHPSELAYHIKCDSNFIEEYRNVFPDIAEKRKQIFMNYVENLMKKQSLDDLAELGLFTCEISHETNLPSLSYRLEHLLPLYFTTYVARLLHPDAFNGYIIKLIGTEVHSFRNLFKSFKAYLEDTEDRWVFEYSEPVPQEILENISKN